MAAAETVEKDAEGGRGRVVGAAPDATDAPVRVAQADLTPAPDVAGEYGWYAELELRSFMKRLFKGSDVDQWVPPNPRRAEFYDPFDLPERRFKQKCGLGSLGSHGRSGTDLCPCYPDKYERRLRRFNQFEVSDDRIVVPMSVIEEIDPEPGDNLPYSQEFSEKIIAPIAAHMVVFEDARREHPGHGTDYDGKFDGFQSSGAFYSNRGDELAEERHRQLYLTKPDPRPIYIRIPPDHPLCELNTLYENRVRDNRTLYALIVARDSHTGTGKTTLGVQLARTWDQHGWTADRGTLDPTEYFDQYVDEDTPTNSCIILDEAEQAADNRRSMNEGNVKLSHLWATMRYREIYSIATMPSASTIDKRLKEYADLYIVVRQRGLAMVYESKVDDITGEQFFRPMHRIRWAPADDDPEYQKLSQKKAQRMKNYAENFAYGDDEDDVDPDVLRRQARKERRNELIERMAELGYRQEDIGEVVGLERSMVSRIVNQ